MPPDLRCRVCRLRLDPVHAETGTHCGCDPGETLTGDAMHRLLTALGRLLGGHPIERTPR